MEATQAWEALHDPARSGHLKMDEYRRLMLRAGYPREVVRRASLRRGWDRLSEGQVV